MLSRAGILGPNQSFGTAHVTIALGTSYLAPTMATLRVIIVAVTKRVQGSLSGLLGRL